MKNVEKRSVTRKSDGVLRKIVAKGALAVSKFSANSACIFMIHQPKLPDSVKALRKF